MTEETQQSLIVEGCYEFRKALGRGILEELTQRLQGKPMGLISYDDIQTRLLLYRSHQKGLQDVCLDQIVGSHGRCHDFTRKLRPKLVEMQERWSHVYAQVCSQEGLPPIGLYLVSNLYFIYDGHHRVSIARHLGSITIQAYVTEYPTTAKLEPEMTLADIHAAILDGQFLEEKTFHLSRPHRYPPHRSLRQRK